MNPLNWIKAILSLFKAFSKMGKLISLLSDISTITNITANLMQGIHTILECIKKLKNSKIGKFAIVITFTLLIAVITYIYYPQSFSTHLF